MENKLRKLNGNDIYLLSSIIDKIDITMPPIPKTQDDESQKTFGMELMMLFVRKIYKAKDEINELIMELTGKDTKDMALIEIKDTFIEIMSQEGFKSFFK